MSKLEVIIPVKDRIEIDRCVRSLLPSQLIQKIWICDGGSVDSDYIKTLQKLQHFSKVYLLAIPIEGFNKSYLLNQGILAATSEYLLLSDADIVWNDEALQALIHCILEQDDCIACVQEVQESDPTTIALRRDRYTYRVTPTAETIDVELLPIDPDCSQTRIGCGLICARRSTLLKLGGFQSCFRGWGWEDQDLLIRAELMGVHIRATGRVTHLSHSDVQRNQYCQDIEPTETRDRNIQACFARLATGNLQGDLASETRQTLLDRPIRTQLPPSFTGKSSPMG